MANASETIETRVTRLEGKFQEFRDRVVSYDKRFDHLEERINQVEERINQVEERINHLDEKIDRFREELSGRMDQLSGRMDRMQTEFLKYFRWITGFAFTTVMLILVAVVKWLFFMPAG